MDPEDLRVVYVEFDHKQKHPIYVFAHETMREGVVIVRHYEFEMSKRHGLLFQFTGIGGSTDTIHLDKPLCLNKDGLHRIVYWADPDMTVIEPEEGCTRLEALPESYTLENLLDDTTFINCEYGILWCSRCRDYMPNNFADYCKHIWYCRECQEPSLPGERCRHKRQ